MDKYYKVVSYLDGCLVSLCAIGKWRIVYTPNEWISGIGKSKIFIFNSLAAARQCKIRMRGYEIWECDVTNVSSDVPVKIVYRDGKKLYFHEGYEYYWNNDCNVQYKRAEMGGSFLDSKLIKAIRATSKVKLTRKID